MRSQVAGWRPRVTGPVVVVVLLVFAFPIFVLAPPGAASAVTGVVLFSLVAGLAVQGWLNRRYHGRWQVFPPRPATYLVPADLPPPPGLLTGRTAELTRIGQALDGHRAADGGGPLVVITGGEGVGKSALVVTAAHLLAGRYPDGQILIRFDTQRIDGPEHARKYLRQALTARGESEPTDEFPRWFRRRTARKRILIVLDNVPDNLNAAEFRPSGRHCGMLVSSRTPVKNVNPDLLVELAPLADTDARALLERLVGGGPTDDDPQRIGWIVREAHGYPAALHMAGAVVGARRGWGLEVAFSEVTRLRNGMPEPAAPPFVAVLDLACALLTEQERAGLTLLSLLDGRRVASWMLTALARGSFPDWAGFDDVAAGRVLDRLARLRFTEMRLDERTGVVVHRVPGYVKAYGRTLLARDAAMEGVTARAEASYQREWQSRLARDTDADALRRVYQLLNDGSLDNALNLARETLHSAGERRRAANAKAAAAASDEARAAEAVAAEQGEDRARVALAEVFAELGWVDDALRYARLAEQSPDVDTNVRALRVQGRIRWRLRQSAAAVNRLELAEQASTDDIAERIRVLRELTIAHALSPTPEPGLGYARQAIELCGRDEVYRRRTPGVLWAYGLALTANKQYDEANEQLDRADTLSGIVDLHQGLWRPWIRHQRAYVALQLKQYDLARQQAASALDGFTAIIHRYGAGHCRSVIGRSYLEEGNFERAVPALEEALQTFERCGDRWIEAHTAYFLGVAYTKTPDRGDDAQLMLRTALDLMETLKDQRNVIRIQTALRDLPDGPRLGRLGRKRQLDPAALV